MEMEMELKVPGIGRCPSSASMKRGKRSITNKNTRWNNNN